MFKHRKPLMIENLNNRSELQKYRGLHWKNKYSGAKYSYDTTDGSSQKPFLAVPLMAGSNSVGVIRAANSRDGRPFAEWAKEAFMSFGGVISRRIEIDTLIHEQQKTIENLIKIGSIRSNKPRAFAPIAKETIVKEAQKLLRASDCDLYMLDSDGERVQSIASTDPGLEKKRQKGFSRAYERGEGLTGWIFKTGKPLLIDETSLFNSPQRLDDQELCRYSDSYVINEDDRTIQAVGEEVRLNPSRFRYFLGVPLLSPGGKTIGVLTALSESSNRAFTARDLRLLQDFAGNVSLIWSNIKRQELNNTLIRIGQEYGDRLFQYVVEQMPQLVLAKGCSIFRRSDDGSFFQLKYTSSSNMIDRNTREVLDIRYKPGVGKTGLVAKTGRSLIINHYGAGNLDHQRLMKDYNVYAKYQDTNLVGLLRDCNGAEVGLARLIRIKRDAHFSNLDKDEFDNFLKSTIYSSSDDSLEVGLRCNEEKKRCEEGITGFSRSFLAVPLKDRQGNIYGVMRIPRCFPGGIFTEEDLALTESISNRLSSVLEREKIVEQNLTTLSRINVQINSSFASENSEKILSSILEAVTDTLGFEFATIQLVQRHNNTIISKMGMKNKNIPDAIDPMAWVGTEHLLDPPDGKPRDIHVWLLREYRKEYTVKGWDPHFDPEIYYKYGHDKLIRAFIPIIAQNPEEEIGTIEAGYDITRKPEIDEKALVMLKALADAAAIAIRNRNLQDELFREKLLPRVTHILRSPTAQAITLLRATERELGKTNPNPTRLKEYTELWKRTALEIEMHCRKSSVESPKEAESQKCRTVDLINLLEDQCKVFRHYDKLIELHQKDQCTGYILSMTPVERKRMELIICNLLHNAIKYSPQDGIVKVNCCKTEESIMISVIDEGPGIPKEYLKDIWKGSYQVRVDGWPEGAGRGLRDTHDLVRELGWNCRVTSEQGQGATFIIDIPKSWRAAS